MSRLPARAALALAILSVGACEPGSTEETYLPTTDTLSVARTIITAESGLIGVLADVSVGPEGRLYMSDFILKNVTSVRPDGTDPQVWGREGEGPGEFKVPSAISIGEFIWVYDQQLGRVQKFSVQGDYLSGYTVEVTAFGWGVINSGGQLVVGTSGLDSSLVAVLNVTGGLARRLGSPEAPPAEGFNFGSIKDRIVRGEIPEEYRNSVLPVWGADESIWLVFQTEPRVSRFDASGQLILDAALSDAAFESILQQFFKANREEENPARLHPLFYVSDATEHDGDLWVLLRMPREEPAVLLVLDDETARVIRRLVIPGVERAGPLSVGPDGTTVYLGSRADATLVEYSVPPVHD